MGASAALALQVVGTVVSFAGQMQQAAAAEEAAAAQAAVEMDRARVEAHMLEQQAKEQEFNAEQFRDASIAEGAIAQRRAIEEDRKKKFLVSAAEARGGGSDPSVIKNIGDIGSEGEFRALQALFEGNLQSRALNAQAGLEEFSASLSRDQGNIALQSGRQTGALIKNAGSINASSARSKAMGTLLSGASAISGDDMFKPSSGGFDPARMPPPRKPTRRG